MSHNALRKQISELIPYRFKVHWDKFLKVYIITVDTSLNSISIPEIVKIKDLGIIKFTKKEYK